MIDTSPDFIWQEIQAAEELRRRHLSNTQVLVRRYLGNYYRTDSRTRNRPENLLFSYSAEMLPQLVFDNPAVSCKAARLITHKPIADFMRMMINGWIKHTRFRDEAELLALDTLFNFGFAMIGLEPRSDYGKDQKTGVWGRFTMEALQPFAMRLSPGTAIIDSQCNELGSARILGHQYQRDLSDLVGDERYDQAIVSRLSADDAYYRGTQRADLTRMAPKGNEPFRSRATLYQIYIPELNQIGAITTQSGDPRQPGSASWIRPLAPYHGPHTGPYVFIGVYGAPDQPYPLSPLAAMAEQDQELNAHAVAAASRAATSRRVVITDSNNPQLGDALASSGDGQILKIKGFNPAQAAQYEIGGNTREQLEYMGLMLERADRISGQSEARRGRAQGVTATEAQIAEANGDNRSEFIQLKFREGIKRVLEGVGWYCFYDDAVVQAVSDVDPVTGQPFEGLFMGGLQPGQENMSWLDFFLDLEPYSMRRMDPAVQQQQAQMALEIAVEVAPLIVQFPYMNWQSILDMIGEAANIPDFARRILNPQGLMLIQQGMMPGQMMGAGPMAMAGLPGGVAPAFQAAAGGAPVGMMQGPRQPPQMAGPMSPQQVVGQRVGGLVNRLRSGQGARGPGGPPAPGGVPVAA